MFKNYYSPIRLFAGKQLAAFVLSTACLSTIASATVTLSPGEDVAAAVKAAPAGTTFLLTQGVYRMQSIVPKNNDVFVGEGKAILNGSMILSFQRDSSAASLYAASATALNTPSGECASGFPLCGYPQDLFVDGALQTPVSTPSLLKSGSWYFNRTNKQVYLAVNPVGHVVELGMTAYAFSGTATGVQVRSLTVEQYATPAHTGAIGGFSHSAGWMINSVEVRWNHGTGISVGPGSQIIHSYIHHNGQMGLAISTGANSLVGDNEIAWNNYAGFLITWEAGGTKFWETTNLLVRGNYVHDNYGKGLWTDTDNVGTVYEFNTVLNNQDVGIQHEVSYAASIHNNVVQGNIPINTTWLGNAQIRVESSPNVQVYDNSVEVSAAGGHGIAVVNDRRGSGTLGPWTATNDYVHNNTVVYLGASGQSGMTDDNGGVSSLGSRFDSNRYIEKTGGTSHWCWFGHQDWQSFRAKGQEIHGTCCK